MRRSVYVMVGVVIINLALMVAMYVHLQKDEGCDVVARGLVIWDGEQQTWLLVEAPAEPSGLPPCTGRSSNELTILPG